MKYKIILWDIDGTILNFKAAEAVAILTGFKRLNLGPCPDSLINDYSLINEKWWKRLESKECTKQEILIGRFKELFSKYNLDVSKAEEFNSHYQYDLGDTIVFNDNAFELLKSIKVPQIGVTNGTKIAQTKKIKASHLDEVVERIFISEDVGAEKPTPEFFVPVFDYIKQNYGDIKKDEIVIIGDSLTSDIQGGNNAGIAVIWYNKEHKKNNSNLRIDYEINDLQLLKTIL